MSENPWRKPVKRPIGVTIVLILSMLSTLRGVAGFFLTVNSMNGEASLPIVIVTFLLIFGLGASAVWAWFPHNEARIAFVVFAVLDLLWPVLLALLVFAGDNLDAAKEALLVIIKAVMRSFLTIAVVWYFMTAGVVAYYRQDDGNQNL